MRHISLSLLSFVLVFGCNRHPEPQIQEEEFVEETTVTPMDNSLVGTSSAATSASAANYSRPTVVPEERAFIEEPIVIQEEEVYRIEPVNEGEIQRTYNELQISDDVDDFPLYESFGGRTYNETQLSD